MARKTKVMGFSLPPETYQKIEGLLKTSHKTKRELTTKIKEETGLNVYINQLIHARLIPDSPEKKIKIIALYYHCTPVSGKEKVGGGLEKLEWVEPTKIFHYFTTSTADEVVSFLGTI